MEWIILTPYEFYLTIIYWFLMGMFLPPVIVYAYKCIKERRLI